MKSAVRQAVVLFTLVLLCVAGTANAGGVDMKEGEWEISSQTTMEGMPIAMPPSASKSTYCLTREDMVPKSEKDKECRIVKQTVTGNKVSWRMECKKAEGEGEISYRGAAYNGFFKMKMVEDGQTITMNMKMSGKYLGPCPKGQKSGATGETAKQVARGQEMAVQAQQRQAEIKAEQAANAKKGEALIKRSVVPAEESGACAQTGFGRTPECGEKAGDLNLQPGEYEITVEKVSRVGATYGPVAVERKAVCVTEDAPVPYALGAGTPRTVKRGKERITWTDAAEGRRTKGGILYRGDSLDGALTTTMDLGSGQQALYVTKVSGRRTGDGGCVEGRDYTSKAREDSAKKKGGDPAKKDGSDSVKKDGGDSAVGEIKILKDPVKGIRNLFGF